MATVKSREETREREKRLIGEIEKKHGMTVRQLYAEREKRVTDAIELREPDRVPVTINVGAFAARYAGLTASAQYYDHAAYREACKRTIIDFEPDTGAATAQINSGLVMELLDTRHQKWPGGNLSDDAPYQFVEGEYMKADEYDLFLSDPSDFMFRHYLPRLYGTLAPFSKLPPFRTMVGGTGFTAILGLFARPEYRELAEKLSKAAEEQQRLAKESADFAAEMERLGFPSQQQRGNTPGGAPFDAVSDYLRGMRGAMIDMYRFPDKLLAVCDKILEWRIERSTPANPKAKGELVRGGGAPLHRGSTGFMSIKQFEKFYWPGLKKAVMAAVDLGYTTSSFCEGVWDDRLEYWLEIPRGKAILRFEKTDMFKAKEVLGNHHCIQGGVPSSLLEVGSPQEVEDYCKKLIKVCGKGGGFILGPGSSIDYAKPANIKAMVDSAKKYRH